MKKLSYFLICGLVTMFISCGNSKSTPKYESYRDAVAANDFAAAHDSLDAMHAKYIEKMSESSFVSSYQKEQQIYFEALEYVYSKEIAFLLTDNVDGAEDRVVFGIMEIPVDGKVQEGKLSFNKLEKDWKEGMPLNAISEAYSKINIICNKALVLSINRGNKAFAMNVLELYKEDIVVTFDDEFQHNDFVQLNWTTKEAAKMKVDAAIKDGRLK